MFQIIQGGTIRGGDLLVTIIRGKQTHALVGVKGGVVPIGAEDAKPQSLNSGVLLIQDYNYIFVKHNHVSNINDTIVINIT